MTSVSMVSRPLSSLLGVWSRLFSSGCCEIDSTQVDKTQIFQDTSPMLLSDETGKRTNLPIQSNGGALVRKDISHSMNILKVSLIDDSRWKEMGETTHHNRTDYSKFGLSDELNLIFQASKFYQVTQCRGNDGTSTKSPQMTRKSYNVAPECLFSKKTAS